MSLLIFSGSRERVWCAHSGINILVPTIQKQITCLLEASWNVMAHVQKPDFVSWWNGRVHLNRRGHQFSRLLAAKVCTSAVVILDTPCSEVVWRVLATHSICQFPLHFPSCMSPCAITFQLESTSKWNINTYFHLYNNFEFVTHITMKKTPTCNLFHSNILWQRKRRLYIITKTNNLAMLW